MAPLSQDRPANVAPAARRFRGSQAPGGDPKLDGTVVVPSWRTQDLGYVSVLLGLVTEPSLYVLSLQSSQTKIV